MTSYKTMLDMLEMAVEGDSTIIESVVIRYRLGPEEPILHLSIGEEEPKKTIGFDKGSWSI